MDVASLRQFYNRKNTLYLLFIDSQISEYRGLTLVNLYYILGEHNSILKVEYGFPDADQELV